MFRALIPVLLAALVPMGSALADEPVSSRMDAYRVVTATNGSEQLEAAASVKPGDVIEYQIVYDNAGARSVSDLRINGPIPSGTLYVDGSARTTVRSQLKFSADGGASWQAAPVKRKSADGKRDEAVPPTAYTNVQWTAQEPLQQGASQKYRYRVRVADDASLPAQ